MLHLFAYLDAGTGSMILQALMGGMAGVLVISRVAWRSLRARLGIETKKESPAK